MNQALFIRPFPLDNSLSAPLAIGPVIFLTFLLSYAEQLPTLNILIEEPLALETQGKIIILISIVLGRYGTLLFSLGPLLRSQASGFRYAEGKVAIE